MAKWKKHTLKLKKGHTWTAKPGCRIFVSDAGAVRFDFPQTWVLHPGPDAINLYDRQPPDDNCRLTVSYQRLPAIDWSGLALAPLLHAIVVDDPRELVPTIEMITVNRPDLRFVWIEGWFKDPHVQRGALSRIGLGLGGNIQVLLTCEYWVEDAGWFRPVWETVVDSLQVGAVIPDPTHGPLE